MVGRSDRSNLQAVIEWSCLNEDERKLGWPRPSAWRVPSTRWTWFTTVGRAMSVSASARVPRRKPGVAAHRYACRSATPRFSARAALATGAACC